MKNLKIILFLLIINLGTFAHANSEVPPRIYFHSFKGGVQSTNNLREEITDFSSIEGTYEKYMLLIKYKLDYRKDNKERSDIKNDSIPAKCTVKEPLEISCL